MTMNSLLVSPVRAELSRAMQHVDARVGRCDAVDYIPGSVGGIVVHDDELAVESLRRVPGKNRLDQIGQAVAFVVGGNDDGEGGWARRGAQGSDSQAL